MTTTNPPEVVRFMSRSNIVWMFALNAAISDLTCHSIRKILYLISKYV